MTNKLDADVADYIVEIAKSKEEKINKKHCPENHKLNGLTLFSIVANSSDGL